MCPTGTYSTVTNAPSCTDWQACAANFTEGAPGSNTMDRMCVTTALWTRQFGTASSDVINSTSVGSDESVVVAGETYLTLAGETNAGSTDAFIQKYDATGTLLWTHQFGSVNADAVHSVWVDADASILVAGRAGTLPGQTGSGAFIQRYDSDGTLIWTRQFGTGGADTALSVAVGSDGSILVAGRTSGALAGQTAQGDSDAFVQKYDADGTLVWTRQFGTTNFDEATAVSVDGGTGAVLVAGRATGALVDLGATGTFLRKYFANGTHDWTQQFSTGGSVGASAVVVDDVGRVFVAGGTRVALPGQTSIGGSDGFLQMYDLFGVLFWTRQFGTSVDDYVSSVTVDAAGDVLVAGAVSSFLPGQTYAGGAGDAFVQQYNSSGTLTWTRMFGSLGNDYAASVSATDDGRILLGGSTGGTLPGQSSAGQTDAFVLELRDPN